MPSYSVQHTVYMLLFSFLQIGQIENLPIKLYRRGTPVIGRNGNVLGGCHALMNPVGVAPGCDRKVNASLCVTRANPDSEALHQLCFSSTLQALPGIAVIRAMGGAVGADFINEVPKRVDLPGLDDMGGRGE